jgi:hypothetical protein
MAALGIRGNETITTATTQAIKLRFKSVRCLSMQVCLLSAVCSVNTAIHFY